MSQFKKKKKREDFGWARSMTGINIWKKGRSMFYGKDNEISLEKQWKCDSRRIIFMLLFLFHNWIQAVWL